MSDIRSSIRVSWERSIASLADADHPNPTYFNAVDQESAMLRAARPVLASLAAELANEPVCLILTDARGVILYRGGGDPSLIRALDAVSLAPGFRYAEPEVGTNGIGTALEVGDAILINGDEHFAGDLRPFSCAGALIKHPATGRLLGVIDITTKVKNSNPLLLSFAKLAAHQVQERLLEEANELEGALLSGYYAACRHSGGPVVAVSERVFMMNDLAQQQFDANDQAALLGQSRETVGRGSACTVLADLPSGITARLAYRPAFVRDALAGGIIQIKEQHRTTSNPGPRVPALAGLVGRSPTWRHTVQEVMDAVSRPEWVVLQGEAGVGKLALATAAHQHGAPERRLAVVDATDSEDPVERAAAELDGGSDLVVRGAHLLSGEQLDRLSALLQHIQDNSVAQDPWVAMTTQEDQMDGETSLHLLHFFPRTVRVPPLRHHLDDLPDLVRLLLDRAGARELTLAKPAMNQLMRLSWPGNVTQLRQTLVTIARTRRSGVVDRVDLPPECQATTRRSLSRMEALERDAIVEAIGFHDGDKTAAAESLGMSRATIYRKIRDYGIVT